MCDVYEMWRINMYQIIGGSRMLGIGLVSILSIMVLALGALALNKYLSKRK
jgi:hypothetical protein